MAYTRKQSAMVGLLGLAFFVVGFIIFPNLLYKGINLFVLLGFLFFAFSISQPLFPNAMKLLGK